MKRVLLAGVGVLAITASLTSAALAADLGRRPEALVYKAAPVYAPAFSWTGLYIGGSVGGRWAAIDVTGVSFAGGAPTGNVSSSFDSATGRFGGYVGYNWQVAPNWLIGIEADLAWGDGSDTQAFVLGVAAVAGDSFTVKHRWDGSVRGRLGLLATPTWLLYATGGIAWQDLEASANLTGIGAQTNSDTRTGWTVGAGVEAALTANWLARAEYRFSDYDTWRSTFFGGTGFDTVVDVNATTHTVYGGLAYKF
jgi:outer membrane immunogenic protein